MTTAPTAPSPAPPSIPELVEAIEREYRQCLKGARSTVDHAIRVGELLTDLKRGMSHGDWLAFAEENFPFSVRTAQKFMRLHEKRDALANTPQTALLGIEGTLRALADGNGSSATNGGPEAVASSGPVEVAAEPIEPAESLTESPNIPITDSDELEPFVGNEIENDEGQTDPRAPCPRGFMVAYEGFRGEIERARDGKWAWPSRENVRHYVQSLMRLVES